jgi:hypothetical protein
LSGYASNPNTITSFNSKGLPTSGNAYIAAFPNDLPTALTYHYSLETEYDLGHQLIASVGYQGSTSHHLIDMYQANSRAAMNKTSLNPLVTNVEYFGNEGGANNSMLLAGLKHQFSHQFSADAQFTWAKSMDNTSGPYTTDNYPYNSAYSWGRSDFDIGKSFKLFGMWQPVFFHGSQNWMEKTVGGWSLSGILNLHSGFGWTPQYSTQTLYYNGSWTGSLRPAYLGGGHHKTTNDAFKSGPSVGDGQNQNYPNILTNVVQGTYSYSNKYFRMDDYSAAVAGDSFPGVAAGTPPAPGLARNSFPGPRYRNVDATLSKSFGLPKVPILGEQAKVNFRVDAYNLFNLLNFDPGSVSNSINSTDFGQARSALGSRTVSMEARFNF